MRQSLMFTTGLAVVVTTLTMFGQGPNVGVWQVSGGGSRALPGMPHATH